MRISTAQQAREIAAQLIHERFPHVALVTFGLPELDHKSTCWRIALTHPHDPTVMVGQIMISIHGTLESLTDVTLIEQRITRSVSPLYPDRVHSAEIVIPALPNKVVLGDAQQTLSTFAPECVQLVFTSPPYYNARPQYHESLDYPSYLKGLETVFQACHRVLSEGRFLVINISPILVPRTNRTTSSIRVPIPFDLHPILKRLGFDFIDDIIWKKPDGAGCGRGRGFASSRKPLQYKPEPITENVLVYRKRTSKLIDWNLRNHPNQEAVQRSLVNEPYERTNVWEIQPAYHKKHPAVFPEELARKVIRYYSFQGDMVLDPFAGSGTVGKVALAESRRFLLCENKQAYFDLMRREIGHLADLFHDRIDFDDMTRWLHYEY